MRIVSGTRIAPVALAAALALVLAACVPAPPPVTLPPQPSSTPLFASEEEALAAAEEVYGAYLAAVNTAAQGGWVDLKGAQPYATSDAIGILEESVEQLITLGWRQSGDSSFSSFELQSYRTSESQTEVNVYLCLDVSETRLLDSDGSNVTPLERTELISTEVRLVAQGEGPLLVDRSTAWSGPAFC